MPENETTREGWEEQKMDLKTLNDRPPWEWPEETDEILLGVLRDANASEPDRLLAAELAGDLVVINDELADELLSIALSGEEPAALRETSVISLGPCLEQVYIDEFDDPDEAPVSEETFKRIQETLRTLYADAEAPESVRRRTLEASVRAAQDWHPNAIRAAYASGEKSWRLTAVFCMRFVRGFNEQILESLESEDPDIHYEAVRAAGNWELQAAWSHIAALLTNEGTEKSLLLAAIEAVVCICPEEAGALLIEHLDSPDDDIAEAATEAITLAKQISERDDYYDPSLN